MSKRKNLKGDYPPVLSKPIKIPGLINGGADPDSYVAREQGRRLALLCDYYRVPRDKPLQLARRIAESFIPGFQVAGEPRGQKRGPKAKWTTDRRQELVDVVDEIRRERGITKKAACRAIARESKYSKKWGRSTRSQSLEQWVNTLVARYHDGKKERDSLRQGFLN